MRDFQDESELSELIADLSPGEGLSSTPEYISPEIVQDGIITPQADIYSLGVVLFELLSGQHPFPDLPPAALLEHHLHNPLPRERKERSVVLRRSKSPSSSCRLPATSCGNGRTGQLLPVEGGLQPRKWD